MELGARILETSRGEASDRKGIVFILVAGRFMRDNESSVRFQRRPWESKRVLSSDEYHRRWTFLFKIPNRPRVNGQMELKIFSIYYLSTFSIRSKMLDYFTL